jgi:hypothetical protein
VADNDDGLYIRESLTCERVWFVCTPASERLAMFRAADDAELFVAAKREALRRAAENKTIEPRERR